MGAIFFSKYFKELKSSVKPYYALSGHGTPRLHYYDYDDDNDDNEDDDNNDNNSNNDDDNADNKMGHCISFNDDE